MTKDLSPGRELDALVAEKVMSIEPWPGVPGAFKAKFVPNGQVPKPCHPPEYSTDIVAAWQVIEYMRKKHHWTRLELNNFGMNSWHVSFEKGYAVGESAPHAICLAALKRLGR